MLIPMRTFVLTLRLLMSYIYGAPILDVSRSHTTTQPVGRTPLDEGSARRRDLYLTIHSTHYRQTSMPLVEFEPTVSAGERPQTYALDRTATGTGKHQVVMQPFQ